MFGIFNDAQFPHVHVALRTIHEEDDFTEFCRLWQCFDNRKVNYTFIFDATNVGYIPVKYAYRMCNFISKLKEKKKRENNVFLEKSIIISDKWYVNSLLYLIFSLVKPVAPVYIVQSKQRASRLIDQLALNSQFYDDDSVTFFSN